MGIRDKIIGFIQRNFGQKLITGSEDFETVGKEIDNVVVEMDSFREDDEPINNWKSDFDQSLIVDGVSSQRQPRYEKIQNDLKQQLQNSFEKFSQTVRTIEYQVEEENEGYIGEKPFVCYAEIGNDGEIKATILVTKEACRKIEKDEEEEYTYQEVRNFKDGFRTVIGKNNHTISIDSKKRLSQEKINEMMKFSDRNKKNANKRPNLNEMDLAIYDETMRKLGVNNLENDKENYAYFRNGRQSRNNLIEVSGVYDKTKENSKPELINFNMKKDGRYSSKKYRLTNDGKYIDESSFKVIDGKPQYQLVSYDQIKEFAKTKGLDLEFGEKVKQVAGKEDSIIPQEAISIHEDMVASQERQQVREKSNIVESSKDSI